MLRGDTIETFKIHQFCDNSITPNLIPNMTENFKIITDLDTEHPDNNHIMLVRVYATFTETQQA